MSFSFWISVSWGLGLAMSLLLVWIMTPPLNLILWSVLADVEGLSEQIEQFHAKTHQYPKTYEALNEALHKVDRDSPMRKREKNEEQCLLIPLEDPWGGAYRYCFPGIHRKNTFDLFSLGQDGQVNTKDDINNWDQENLGKVYGPSWFGKLFRDAPLFGVFLFWFVIFVLMEIVSIIVKKNSWSLWKKLQVNSHLNSHFVAEDSIKLGSILISAIFLLIIMKFPTILDQLAYDKDSILTETYLFRSKTGRYPHTPKELQKVFSQDSSQPLVERIQTTEGLYFLIPIKDPWGQNYRYRSPGFHHPESFDLWSLGQDSQMGTIDDVKSWDDSWRGYYGPGVFRQFLYDHPLLSLAIFWWGIAIFLKCLEWLLYGRIKEVEKNE